MGFMVLLILLDYIEGVAVLVRLCSSSSSSGAFVIENWTVTCINTNRR